MWTNGCYFHNYYYEFATVHCLTYFTWSVLSKVTFTGATTAWLKKKTDICSNVYEGVSIKPKPCKVKSIMDFPSCTHRLNPSFYLAHPSTSFAILQTFSLGRLFERKIHADRCAKAAINFNEISNTSEFKCKIFTVAISRRSMCHERNFTNALFAHIHYS